MISKLPTGLKVFFFTTLCISVAFGQANSGSEDLSVSPSQAQGAPANAQNSAAAATPAKVDRAASYYHYCLAHIYEELVSMYGRSEFATKAIEEYRQAIDNDPQSGFLNAGLAELYFKTGRIRDAVLESQDLLKRDPDNLDARKLLGRIYLRSLGDMQSGTQSQEVLQLAIDQYSEIVRLEPKSADNHLLLGRLFMLNKDLLKAEREFKAAREVQPDSEEAVSNLAYLYNEEGDTTKAVSVINSIPDAQRSARLYAALGYTYEQQHDYKNAVESYKKSVEIDGDNLDARRGLAQNLLNDGKPDGALEQYRKVSEEDPQDAQTYLRISEILRHQGKLDDALANLKKAESLVQDSLDVPFNEALIYQQQGKFDEAAAILQDLIKKTSKPVANMSDGERNNYAVFLEHLAAVYHDQNKTQPQMDTLRKMTDLGGDNAIRGYQNLVDAFREGRQWDDATKTAKEATQKFPKDRGLQLLLASQLADVGQPDKGVATAEALLKGTSEDREVYLTLGQIQMRLRHWKEAEDAIHKASALSQKPEDHVYINFLLGSLYEHQKRYDAAEEKFREVLKTDPHNSMTLNYLGYMLADHGQRLEEALTMIKRAVEEDPQNGAYLDSLGWVHFRLGNLDQAEEYLRMATERLPSDPTVHDHLGDLYMRIGRVKLAADQWERSLGEYNRSLSADIDQGDLAKVQHKLESARVKLARESGQQQK